MERSFLSSVDSFRDDFGTKSSKDSPHSTSYDASLERKQRKLYSSNKTQASTSSTASELRHRAERRQSWLKKRRYELAKKNRGQKRVDHRESLKADQRRRLNEIRLEEKRWKNESQLVENQFGEEIKSKEWMPSAYDIAKGMHLSDNKLKSSTSSSSIRLQAESPPKHDSKVDEIMSEIRSLEKLAAQNQEIERLIEEVRKSQDLEGRQRRLTREEEKNKTRLRQTAHNGRIRNGNRRGELKFGDDEKKRAEENREEENLHTSHNEEGRVSQQTDERVEGVSSERRREEKHREDGSRQRLMKKKVELEKREESDKRSREQRMKKSEELRMLNETPRAQSTVPKQNKYRDEIQNFKKDLADTVASRDETSERLDKCKKKPKDDMAFLRPYYLRVQQITPDNIKDNKHDIYQKSRPKPMNKGGKNDLSRKVKRSSSTDTGVVPHLKNFLTLSGKPFPRQRSPLSETSQVDENSEMESFENQGFEAEAAVPLPSLVEEELSAKAEQRIFPLSHKYKIKETNKERRNEYLEKKEETARNELMKIEESKRKEKLQTKDQAGMDKVESVEEIEKKRKIEQRRREMLAYITRSKKKYISLLLGNV